MFSKVMFVQYQFTVVKEFSEMYNVIQTFTDCCYSIVQAEVKLLKVDINLLTILWQWIWTNRCCTVSKKQEDVLIRCLNGAMSSIFASMVEWKYQPNDYEISRYMSVLVIVWTHITWNALNMCDGCKLVHLKLACQGISQS